MSTSKMMSMVRTRTHRRASLRLGTRRGDEGCWVGAPMKNFRRLRVTRVRSHAVALLRSGKQNSPLASRLAHLVVEAEYASVSEDALIHEAKDVLRAARLSLIIRSKAEAVAVIRGITAYGRPCQRHSPKYNAGQGR